MLAQMHWAGVGSRSDHASAYAWMDLAAERGLLPFVAKRERYWDALTAQERGALSIGAKVYQEYGDDVAQGRLAHRLRKQARAMTGSRTAMPGAGKVILPTRADALVSISNAGAPGTGSPFNGNAGAEAILIARFRSADGAAISAPSDEKLSFPLPLRRERVSDCDQLPHGIARRPNEKPRDWPRSFRSAPHAL